MAPRRLNPDWLLVPIGLLYFGSFLLPAYEGKRTTITPGIMYGIGAFIYGIFGLSVACPVWLANVFFWKGVVMLRTKRWGRVVFTGGVASLLALFPLCGYDIDGGKGHLLIGYFAWLGSMVLLTLSGVLGLLMSGGCRNTPTWRS